ncbi:MAG: uroporphyrinogen-III synthase, partial [Desulfohalobiaceae bacterium]|nr:uroporphyrinogen-III synthase [Desulfohalobiaceae bacterium]
SLAAPLSEISERALDQKMKPPALLVVGRVVELREKLNWFENRPLLGKGVVVTRAREQASSLLKILQDLGACCYQFPTIAIEALEDHSGLHRAFQNLSSYDWLIFTSVNGVKVFWKELNGQGLDSRALGGCAVAAIGPATAGALRERGVEPDFVPDKYVAEHVVQGLVQRGISRARILLPRAEKAREVLPEALAAAGAGVEVLPVYRTRPAEESGEKILQAIRAGKVHFITFTSSSTVENFFRLVSAEDLSLYVPEQVKLACIGPVTAGTLQRYGFQADLQPEDYTVSSLAGCLRQAVADR